MSMKTFTLQQILDAAQFSLDLSRQRLQESKRLMVGGASTEVRAEVDILVAESVKLHDGFDIIMIVARAVAENEKQP
jgi:hypothetical protein